MAELKVARSHRDIAHALITRLKKHIIRFEEKPDLAKVDRQTVQSLIEKVQAIDDTFKEHHYVIVDQVDDQAAVVAEQDTLDEHEDEVFSYTNRLRQLLLKSQPTAAPTIKVDLSQHLRKRICEVEREARKIDEDIEGLEGMDQCLLQQLKK